jgi:hypothetical protein
MQTYPDYRSVDVERSFRPSISPVYRSLGSLSQKHILFVYRSFEPTYIVMVSRLPLPKELLVPVARPWTSAYRSHEPCDCISTSTF